MQHKQHTELQLLQLVLLGSTCQVAKHSVLEANAQRKTRQLQDEFLNMPSKAASGQVQEGQVGVLNDCSDAAATIRAPLGPTNNWQVDQVLTNFPSTT